jgi:N-acetylglucosaminyldiphosphoundecaprenol N-acetyl-beta-D-mannosaminyltransferase
MIASIARTSEENLNSMPEALSVTGVPVVPFETYDQALDCVEQAMSANRKSFWVAVNPIKIYNAWHTPELLNLLRRTDACFCDGVGVSVASRILNGRSIPRITGCDLFFKLLARASEKQWGIYLLGASPKSNAAAREGIKKMYPNLRIVGWQDGYFKDSNEVVENINRSGADLLFVAMGSPKQEHWISQHRDAINARFCMGVGGSFDVAAGSVKRAPRIFRATGTEFLFRFVMEPRKRLSNQGILLSFLTQVIGRKLFGEGAFVGGAYSHH